MRGGVAVLGAGGFVGSRLLERATHAGRTDIVPVVRAARSIGRAANLGVSYRFGDASRADSLERALAGCEAVVNLTTGDPADIPRTTENIYAAALAAGARLLVHLSSATVYGPVERPGLPDDAPPRLGHWMPYARQKGVAENFLRERMTDGRLAIVVLRPGLVWGPGSPWVLGPATDLVQGRAFLAGGGSGICNLMYVDDLLRGIDAVLAQREPPSGFYHVGDDETITWAEYYAALAAGLGVDPAAIRAVPGDRYRIGLRDRLDELKSLPIYRRIKDRLPLETRAQIRRRLARSLGRGGPTPGTTAGAAVTRELWQLQTTRHRLPTAKFRATFGHHNTVSFPNGIAASLAWLRFIGVGLHEAA
jgi:nucleoside-diphosphate-sugar epimerase